MDLALLVSFDALENYFFVLTDRVTVGAGATEGGETGPFLGEQFVRFLYRRVLTSFYTVVFLPNAFISEFNVPSLSAFLSDSIGRVACGLKNSFLNALLRANGL